MTFRERLTTPEEAVRLIKPGDTVAIPMGTNPESLGVALARRRAELPGVRLILSNPKSHYGWLDGESTGIGPAFIDQTISESVKPALEQKKADYIPTFFSLRYKDVNDSKPIDAVMVEVSPPDANGFCSFGPALLNKRSYIRLARKVLAEVNEGLIRTFGDNFIHVSEIDCLVLPEKPSADWAEGHDMERWENAEPTEETKRIAGFIRDLIKDGDTIQFGVGGALSPLPLMGVCDGRRDLGLHTGAVSRPLVKVIARGLFPGTRKTIHPCKVVTTSIVASDIESLQFVRENPLIELYGIEYVNSIRTVAAHDSMVAINQALAVDLGGQIAADGLGPKVLRGAGGQAEFAIGAMLSRGGRNITIVLSTASGGKTSRIMPVLPAGTCVSVHRSFADYVVTEYGVASLRDKGLRERARELIAVAHPDFREELRREAGKLP